MQKIKEPNFYYKEYSEKIIASIFAMKTDKVDRLIREAKQTLSKEDYEFEIRNVIDSLSECEENKVESEFRSILLDVDKTLYRLITFGTSEPVVVCRPIVFDSTTSIPWTTEERIKSWEADFRYFQSKHGFIQYDLWYRAIKHIGFIPQSAEWQHWQWLAECNKRKVTFETLNEAMQ
jgi:hypothetical protein